MALYLVQHGISASKDVDPEKGLTEAGREDTNRIASVASGYGVNVRRIVHSGKKRAKQTAEIYRNHLDIERPLEEIPGIAPLDDVAAFAETVDPEEGCMVVGHLPFMERLVALLTAGSADLKIYKFQNSGLVCLEREQTESNVGNWYIKWTLNPYVS